MAPDPPRGGFTLTLMLRWLLDQRPDYAGQTFAGVDVHVDKTNRHAGLVPIYGLGMHGNQALRWQRDVQHKVNRFGLLASEVHETAAKIQIVDEHRCLLVLVIGVERPVDAREAALRRGLVEILSHGTRYRLQTAGTAPFHRNRRAPQFLAGNRRFTDDDEPNHVR